jgi:hypothetical protein
VGSGKRLFRDGSDTKALKFVDTKSFGSGVVVLSYEPAGNGAEEQMETGSEGVRSLRRGGLLSNGVGDQRPGATRGG